MSTHSRTTAPKPPLHIHPSAFLSPLTTLHGTHPIILAADCIIQPRATLDATFGTVKCGEGVVVGGGCVVGVLKGEGVLREMDGKEGKGVVLGRGTMLEEGAVVEGDVGVGVEVGVGGRVGLGGRVGDYCKIGPLCTVADGEVLPDYTVLYGCNERRMERMGIEEMRAKLHEKHLETLGRLMRASGGK